MNTVLARARVGPKMNFMLSSCIQLIQLSCSRMFLDIRSLSVAQAFRCLHGTLRRRARRVALTRGSRTGGRRGRAGRSNPSKSTKMRWTASAAQWQSCSDFCFPASGSSINPWRCPKRLRRRSRQRISKSGPQPKLRRRKRHASIRRASKNTCTCNCTTVVAKGY